MTLPVGSYFPNRDQLPLEEDESRIAAQFHHIYYRRGMLDEADTVKISWFGHQLYKCPLDLWIYQELIVRSQPDVIIETGTYAGGSALYLASILDLLGKGKIMTIDIDAKRARPAHPRITYVEGSSTDPMIVEKAKDFVAGARAMVILDSDHSENHVSREMAAYAPLVQVGDYLIVEDTNINGHPTYPKFGPGPMEAVTAFLADSEEFVEDNRCERFMLTFNPRGYLRRIRAQDIVARA